MNALDWISRPFADDGALALVERRSLAPGNFYVLLPPRDDIHRVRTTSAETSVSVHLLTNDTGCVWRHAYDQIPAGQDHSAPAMSTSPATTTTRRDSSTTARRMGHVARAYQSQSERTVISWFANTEINRSRASMRSRTGIVNS